MMQILTLILVLAALFGFLLGVYLVVYRMNVAPQWRLVGGVTGGLFMGSLTAGLTLLMIWPPVSMLFVVGGLGFVGLAALITLAGGNKAANKQMNEAVWSEERGDGNVDLDTYGIDLDAGSRP